MARKPVSQATKNKISRALEAMYRRKGRKGKEDSPAKRGPNKKLVAAGAAGAVAAIGGAAYLRSRNKQDPATPATPATTPAAASTPVVPDPWGEGSALGIPKTIPGNTNNRNRTLSIPRGGYNASNVRVPLSSSQPAPVTIATQSKPKSDLQAIKENPGLSAVVLPVYAGMKAVQGGKKARAELARQVGGFNEEMNKPTMRDAVTGKPVNRAARAAGQAGAVVGTGLREGRKAVKTPRKKVVDDINQTAAAMKRLFGRRGR